MAINFRIYRGIFCLNTDTALYNTTLVTFCSCVLRQGGKPDSQVLNTLKDMVTSDMEC